MKRSLIIGIFFLLVAGQSLFACQCMPLQPLSRKIISEYDLVFVGKVIAVSPGGNESLVKFNILSLYKGETLQQAELEFDSETDCAMSFVPGETWTIYAKWSGKFNVARVEMCGHSRKLATHGEQDYYAIDNRPAFEAEQKFLDDSIGVQEFKSREVDMGHKNQLPDPTQAIIYSLAGLLGLVLIFYFVNRMFKRDGR